MRTLMPVGKLTYTGSRVRAGLSGFAGLGATGDAGQAEPAVYGGDPLTPWLKRAINRVFGTLDEIKQLEAVARIRQLTALYILAENQAYPPEWSAWSSGERVAFYRKRLTDKKALERIRDALVYYNQPGTEILLTHMARVARRQQLARSRFLGPEQWEGHRFEFDKLRADLWPEVRAWEDSAAGPSYEGGGTYDALLPVAVEALQRSALGGELLILGKDGKLVAGPVTPKKPIGILKGAGILLTALSIGRLLFAKA